MRFCRSEYDRGVNTFSPEGRLFQVEYALGAIKLGSTALGIKTNEGVLIASERRVGSCLLESSSVQKIAVVDSHIACAMSGLIADARILIDHARVECANHFFTYDERLSVRSCAEAVADLALDFSGFDRLGPQLFCVDPSGTVTPYLAVSLGSAQEGAETLLQENYHSSLTIEGAEELALVVLRQVMEEKINPNNVEIAVIRGSDATVEMYSTEKLKAILDRLPPPTIPTATDLSSSNSNAAAV